MSASIAVKLIYVILVWKFWNQSIQWLGMTSELNDSRILPCYAEIGSIPLFIALMWISKNTDKIKDPSAQGKNKTY